jgi:NADH pyrophosphatase NudC (nudix superfamily)
MEFLGGFMKGLKPLMDVAGIKSDDSMELTILKGEVKDIEAKKRDALAKIGQITCEMIKADDIDRNHLLTLCRTVDDIEEELILKRIELEKAQEAAELKRQKEEDKLTLRTCSTCGELNEEGTRFCQACGAKLEINKPLKCICKICGAENNSKSSFCGECGAKLELVIPLELKCPTCSEVHAPETRFCNQCGTRLQ